MSKFLLSLGVVTIWSGIAAAQTQGTGISEELVSAALDVPAGSTETLLTIPREADSTLTTFCPFRTLIASSLSGRIGGSHRGGSIVCVDLTPGMALLPGDDITCESSSGDPRILPGESTQLGCLLPQWAWLGATVQPERPRGALV
jgi:hypothetical protein